jgi:hypothetical protein
MRKIFLLIVTLLIGGVHITAQVTIGSDQLPRTGAGLDLNSNNKGLLLPNVSLSDPATGFQLDGGDPATATGMTVYNYSNNLEGPGVYVWDGNQWILITCVPDTPTGITFSKTTGIKLNEQITATATPEVTSGGAKPTQYNWTIPGAYFDIISGANARVITLKAKAAATSITNAIKVNAENSCGTSADYSNTAALSIWDCPGYTITNGAYSGPTTSTLNGDGTTMSQLTGSYGFAVSGNLCLAQADQGSPSTYLWETAKTQCSNLGTGWRLPNIAELGNLQSSRTSYGMFNLFYWSSTEENGVYVWQWVYGEGYTNHGNRDYGSMVRCVKSL